MTLKSILLLLISLSYIYNAEITGKNLILKDAETTLDGTKIPTGGVSFSNQVLSITEAGTYVLSGTLNGQVSVSVSDKIVLV